MVDFNVILFEGFESLDVFGSVEAVGMLNKIKRNCFDIRYYSENGGTVKSGQNADIMTLPLGEISDNGIILIPGGAGVRREVDNQSFIRNIKTLCEKAEYVLTVCTGSALLAKTGLLDGLRATSNKMSFEWVKEQNDKVIWAEKARWVRDGRFYTSSGVSAGIDMTLGFISDLFGSELADITASCMEYVRCADMENDPFAGTVKA